MVPGGAWLVLLFGLSHCRPPDEDTDEGQVSAPPELVAMIPAAVQSTLAAGYTHSQDQTTTSEPVPHAPSAPPAAPAAPAAPAPPATHAAPAAPMAPAAPTTHTIPVATIVISTPSVPAPPKQSFLIVGDTRYAWQEWSEWHCNCGSGTMSRVRDITYSVPGVRLDPVQYDILRFERVVCSYKACECDRTKHQCDHLQASCDRGPMHLCALHDIEQDQTRKRQRFWSKVHKGLKDLWQSIRETFPPRPK
ncbi:protein MENT isoform X2 [Sceloporus undulatus]|nr:protein MENT isoform X2 [Sceloporus undulatus]